MPSYRDKQQWRWRCRIRLPRSGESRRLSGTPSQNTKRAAQRDEAAAVERAIQLDIHPELAIPPAPTLAEFAPDALAWIATHCAATTLANRTRSLAVLCSILGSLRLDAIDLPAVERFRAQAAAQGLATGTINTHTSALRRVLSLARELGRLHGERVTIGEIRHIDGEAEYFPPAELERIFAAAAHDPAYHALVRVAAHCGLRRGELFGLRPRDVGRHDLHVRQQVINGEVRPPKNGKGRTIPLLPDVADALAQIDMSGAYVWPGPSVLGCLTIEGARTRLKAILSAAGIDAPRAGWHTFRHTFASHLVQRGCPLPIVQRLLGHAQITTTMRYAHLAPSSAAEWIQVLAKSWPNSAAPGGTRRDHTDTDGNGGDGSTR